MRRSPLVAVAAFVLLAGCTSADEGGTDEQPAEPVDEATAPQVSEAGPIEFDLPVPEGFEPSDEEGPDVPLSGNHVSYVFILSDGNPTDRLEITSYLLERSLPANDFEALRMTVAQFDDSRGYDADDDLYRRALVHGLEGVHRYLEVEGDESARQYNHYVAQGRHLVHITCQWSTNYAAVMTACEDLEAEFPVPDGWVSASGY
jgi:hypothetical protein